MFQGCVGWGRTWFVCIFWLIWMSCQRRDRSCESIWKLSCEFHFPVLVSFASTSHGAKRIGSLRSVEVHVTKFFECSYSTQRQSHHNPRIVPYTDLINDATIRCMMICTMSDMTRRPVATSSGRYDAARGRASPQLGRSTEAGQAFRAEDDVVLGELIGWRLATRKGKRHAHHLVPAGTRPRERDWTPGRIKPGSLGS